MVSVIAYSAIIRDHVGVLDWLEVRDADLETVAFDLNDSLEYHGSFECLLWLWRRGLCKHIRSNAATSCHLPMLEWLVKNAFLTKQEIVEHCIYKHSIRRVAEVMQTLEAFYEPGVTYSPDVCTSAVSLKSVRVMKWLHSHNFPWNEDTTRAAVLRSTPDVLRYCLKKGCPVKNDCLIGYAIQARNQAVLEWLLNPVDKHGKVFCDPFLWPQVAVIPCSSSLIFLQFLVDSDCPRRIWDKTFNSYDYQGETTTSSIVIA